MTSAERRAVTSLSLLYAFRMLGLFMVFPILALYAEDYRGATPLLIGLALGAYGLSQALLQIPLGVLSDRFGRKPIIVGGLLVFALGSVIAATAESVQLLIFGRFLQGAGAIAGTLAALLADLTREQHLSKAMAAVGASIGLSFSVALVLGPLLAGWLGLSGIFAGTALLALLGIVILLGAVPTPQRSTSYGEQFSARHLLHQSLRNAELMRLNLGVFVLHFILTALFVVVPGMLEGLHLPREAHWQVYLPVLLLSFMIMLPLMISAERHGRIKGMLLTAVGTLTAVPLTVLLTDSYWLLLGCLLLFFIAFNLLEANLPALVGKTVPAQSRGAAMGTFSTCQFLGAFAGGATSGWLLQQFGTAAVFWACALAALGWLATAATMRRPRQRASLAVALEGNEERRQELLRRIRQLPGVENVTVVGEERVAYLQVSERFDPQGLQRLGAAVVS